MKWKASKGDEVLKNPTNKKTPQQQQNPPKIVAQMSCILHNQKYQVLELYRQ